MDWLSPRTINRWCAQTQCKCTSHFCITSTGLYVHFVITPVEQTPAPPAGQSRGGKVPAILCFYNSASLFHSVPPNLVRKLDLGGPVVTNNQQPPAGWNHGGRMPAQSMMTFRAPHRPLRWLLLSLPVFCTRYFLCLLLC